jgi:hypothetical protein
MISNHSSIHKDKQIDCWWQSKLGGIVYYCCQVGGKLVGIPRKLGPYILSWPRLIKHSKGVNSDSLWVILSPFRVMESVWVILNHHVPFLEMESIWVILIHLFGQGESSWARAIYTTNYRQDKTLPFTNMEMWQGLYLFVMLSNYLSSFPWQIMLFTAAYSQYSS